MLSAVLAFLLRQRLRSAACALTVALATLGPTEAAFAQAGSDSGWFDPPDEPSYVSGAPGPTPIGPTPTMAAADVQDADPAALTAFRPALDAYGTWVSDPNYGTVWVPAASAVGADFAPYVSRGHWALTADEDWIWVSDYPFGWAVFHYGRWVWVPGTGWAWVPGLTYANAWVTWRVPTASYAYVGWAPLPPAWVWFYGAAVGIWWVPTVPYVFCPSAYAFDHHVHHHIVHDAHVIRRVADGTHVDAASYRSPARPNIRTTSTAGRGASLPPSVVPRGPRLTAARVPTWAVPASRTAPPVNAATASALRRNPSASAPARSRAVPSDVTRHQVTPDAARPRTTTLPRSSVDVRRNGGLDPSRAVAPAPERIRPMPMPMRDFTHMPATPRPRR